MLERPEGVDADAALVTLAQHVQWSHDVPLGNDCPQDCAGEWSACSSTAAGVDADGSTRTLAQHVQWSHDVPLGKTTAHKTVLENGLRARATPGSGRTAAPSDTGAACPVEPRCAAGEDDCQSSAMIVLELVFVVSVLMFYPVHASTSVASQAGASYTAW